MDESIHSAIVRVLAMQRTDGSFGLWGPWSDREEWLSAYAMDFLTRAKQKGFPVPDFAYKKGFRWLEKSVNGQNFDSSTLNSQSYSLYVLARTGAARVGELRYFHDNYLKELPTALAKAQIAAALAFYGDMKRANKALSEAISSPKRDEEYYSRDYGSELRDRAGLVAIMTETDAWQERVPGMVQKLTELWSAKKYTSTQEKAWLLLAARELLKGNEDLVLSINGREVPPRKGHCSFDLKPGS